MSWRSSLFILSAGRSFFRGLSHSSTRRSASSYASLRMRTGPIAAGSARSTCLRSWRPSSRRFWDSTIGLRPIRITRGRRVHENILKRAATAAATGPTSFSPVDLAELYDFPPGGTGKGQCVAIIELGGGYRPQDLAAYFAENNIKPAPTILPVSVDHAQNRPTGNPQSADGEVMLDIEVVGCVAPDAKIVVYFAPNTDAGFIDAVTKAAHDAANKPSVISISWGGPESSWTAQAMTAFDQALQACAAMGVTVCIASGDSGSSDGVAGGGDHVNFPASSPHALACGGTSLQAANGQIASEVVWNDVGGGASGGGVSAFFALPVWQQGLKATHTAGGAEALAKRGVPDISGDADPETGYHIRVDGQEVVFGGTSAVAPLWGRSSGADQRDQGRPGRADQPAALCRPDGSA